MRSAILIRCNSDIPHAYPDICGVVKTRAKSVAGWADCISEWNIRDP